MSEPGGATEQQDIQALAKGGRTNFLGFLLRLAGRIPFLLLAGRLYGPEALGRFASAMVAIELAGQLCALGQKRGLAQRLSEEADHPANTVADAMLLSVMIAAAMTALLLAFPAPMFPSGQYTDLDRWLPIMLIPATMTDIALSAQAYRYDLATSVRSRAIVEPWTLSILTAVFYFFIPASGLLIAYVGSMLAAAVVAIIPMLRTYGLPRHWRPHPLKLWRLAMVNLPLAVADVVEWGTRRLDIAILGLFASPAAVGVYFVAQQVASLPQKFKTSFDAILGPVITRNLKEGNLAAIARQVCQVGFWITAAQTGIALALGIPGEGVMGLVGPNFVSGTGALAFLLAAEVVAATAVVSEAALIYMARLRNLWVSLATIVLQVVFTVGGILLVDHLGYNQYWRAAAAAAGLMLALGCASLAKGYMLARLLGEPINNWRWALLWAAAPAVAVGWLFTRYLPEWAELSIGIPAILFVYCWTIWHKGFGPEDRVLFRKNVRA